MADFTEIGTMSAAVDDVILRSGRPNRKPDIISYVRTSIREIQVQKGVVFEKDMVEDRITVTTNPAIWKRPENFRRMQTVRYPNVYTQQGDRIYPRYIPPGKRQRNYDYYYYLSGDSYVFANPAGVYEVQTGGEVNIDLAYFLYSLRLPYYEVAERPARFSLEDNEWVYLNATTEEEQEAARAKVTHWILFDWYDAVVEGGAAKIFKNIDDSRAVSTFALFSQLRDNVLRAEPTGAIAGEV